MPAIVVGGLRFSSNAQQCRHHPGAGQHLARLREQLLDAEVDWLDAVLFTHEHADHTHGIDDLRALFIRHRRRLDVYLDEPTSKTCDPFPLLLESPPGSEYPPIVNEHRLVAGRSITIEARVARSPCCRSGRNTAISTSLGFRFGGLGYSCDLSGLPDESVTALAGLDVWIVDALRYRPHPSHFSVEDALGWIERVKPRRAILTNLHADLDYEELRESFRPCGARRDGLVIDA